MVRLLLDGGVPVGEDLRRAAEPSGVVGILVACQELTRIHEVMSKDILFGDPQTEHAPQKLRFNKLPYEILNQL